MKTDRPFNRALPGFSPAYTRTEVMRQPDSTWKVTHYAGDAVGFVTSADVDTYEGLTWAEAVDVLGAVFDGYCDG